MALDYRKCAQEIFDNLGGKDNIVSAAHCATRLRLVIADNSKLNTEALDQVEGVKGMFENGGQLQLIIGTGTVNKVYDEFIDISGVSAASKDEVKAAAAAQQPIWKRMIKTIGDVFVPILPAIVASGLLMGVVEALGKAMPNFASTDWYGFLDMIANTAFAYLPVIVAISAARVFGGNIFLGAVVGLSMIHSALTNGWAAADGYNIWYLFGHVKIGSYTLGQVNQLGYQGHVIPVIIAVFLMSKLEQWLHKHVPEMIDLFVTPITTVFVTCLLTFTIIGPVFSFLETMVLNGAQVLVTNAFGAMIMGAIYPITVVMGLHHMYNVIEAGMLAAEGGLNTWMPIASSANFAQFGACLAVGLKCYNNRTKQVAIPSSLSAALGITEPAIFGVNMRFFKPFVCGMIGGAAGSLFGALVHLGAKAYGVTGIPGYLTITNYPLYTVMLLIAGGIAFALTWVIWKEDEKDIEAENKRRAIEAEKENAEASFRAPDNYVMTCESGKVLAPCNGEVIARDQIPDPTFASGLLGDGVGINPKEGIVVAPFDGTISSVAASKHAIGLTSENGMELLIHVGVDTVKMEGDGFEPTIAEGDAVKEGQVILNFSRDKIKEAGYSDCVVVLMANSDDMKDLKIGEDL
ncbi:MAG: PTS glucose transporter subunit IIA [Eubacterium sp.]|nr:PTS glucose transporter subunit IIA [Eubacterium sp.]